MAIAQAQTPALAEQERINRARQEAIQRALDAYNGQFKEPLKVKPGQMNDNVIVGLIRPVVEAASAFLMGKSVGFTVEVDTSDDSDGDDSDSPGEDEADVPEPAVALVPKKPGPTPEQEALDLFWRANKKMKLLKKASTSAALAGHVFVKVIPDGVTLKGKKYPRLILLDPQCVTVEVDPDDTDVVIAYNITRTTADANGGEVERRQRVERTDYVAGLPVIIDGPSKWQIVDEIRRPGGIWLTETAEVWPFDWCPVHDCQNLPEAFQFWGGADVTDALIGINQTIIFLASNLKRIIKIFADPKPWAKGIKLDEMNSEPGEVLFIPSKDGAIGAVQMSGDTQGIIAALELFRGWFEETTHVPGIALGRLADMPRGGVSGVALELMYQALITRTNDKRESFGEMLVAICSHVLEMMHFAAGLDVELHWQSILPVDRSALATSASAWHDAGVSWKTLISDAGWNADEELERSAQEKLDSAMRQQALAAKTGLSPVPPTPPNAIPAPDDGSQPSGQPQGPGLPPNNVPQRGQKPAKQPPGKAAPSVAA